MIVFFFADMQGGRNFLQRQYARKYSGTRIIRTPRNISRVVCLGGGTFWPSGPGHETLEPFLGRGVWIARGWVSRVHARGFWFVFLSE